MHPEDSGAEQSASPTRRAPSVGVGDRRHLRLRTAAGWHVLCWLSKGTFRPSLGTHAERLRQPSTPASSVGSSRRYEPRLTSRRNSSGPTTLSPGNGAKALLCDRDLTCEPGRRLCAVSDSHSLEWQLPSAWLASASPSRRSLRYGKVVELSSIRSIRPVNATTSSLKIWIVALVPRGTFTAAMLREPRNTKARLNQTECYGEMKKARRSSSRGSTLAVAARPPHSMPPGPARSTLWVGTKQYGTKATLRWHHNERVKTVLSAESSWVPLESSAVCGCRIVPCGTGDGPTTVVAVAGFVSHEMMGVPIASTI